ncbi:MAG: formylglycine-generating enzyme family protein [Bacteroidales bacterium]|nr:formylglycine-generating enzyme family protein [Bacteroidales bacterium]
MNFLILSKSKTRMWMIFAVVLIVCVVVGLLFVKRNSSKIILNTTELEMIFVEGGTFLMGCTEEQGSDCSADERPAHSVTLNSFSIGKYPITQGQWRALMGKTRSQSPKGDNYPIETVSWLDAQKFIQRLNAATGKQYRLPTEAEWEYAARGGNKSRGYKYSGSNTMNEVGWFANNSKNRTRQVGLKLPNELGIHDMSGNTWEWCEDRYGNYPASPQNNPTGPLSGIHRVLRGGGYNYDAQGCRVSCRYARPSEYHDGLTGFRVAHP